MIEEVIKEIGAIITSSIYKCLKQVNDIYKINYDNVKNKNQKQPQLIPNNIKGINVAMPLFRKR